MPRVVARAGATVEVPPDTDFVVDEGVVVSAISRLNRCFILAFAAGGDLVLPFADGAMVEALRPCRLHVVSPPGAPPCSGLPGSRTTPPRRASAASTRAADTISTIQIVHHPLTQAGVSADRPRTRALDDA